METLPIQLFKSSFGPFLELLNENGLQYQMHEARMGIPMASGGTLEIIKAVGDAAFWPALATVIIAFINRRKGRKVIITTQERAVIHTEELSQAELERVLKVAANITAIDTSSETVSSGNSLDM